jgi:nitroreductase
MKFSTSVTDLIRRRYSCRNYRDTPLAPELREGLEEMLTSIEPGPFGSSPRFALAAATERGRKALKGLGTYGFVRNPPAFIIGAMRPGPKNLEDFGYMMERAVLSATDRGLGSCWLGGSFTKGTFAESISATGDETVPAVVSLGYAERGRVDFGVFTPRGSRTHRLSWESLFFEDRFGAPLPRERAGAFTEPLEMLRIGPSASNKQPWRMISARGAWHLYLQRTPGYRTMLIGRLIALDDMQRLDMGIAMCHFELTAREAGLDGCWEIRDPGLARPDELTEYVASWVPSDRQA